MKLLDELNYLAVGEDGTYSHQGMYQSDFSQVQKIVDQIHLSKTKNLEIYFHGGLVSEHGGQESADRVIKALKSTVPSSEKSHQLALIWKTDLITTLKENLDNVFLYGFGRKILAWTERATSKEIKPKNSKSIGSSEGLTIDEIYNEWRSSENTGSAPFANYELNEAYRSSKGLNSGTKLDEDKIAINIATEITAEINNDKSSKNEWLTLPTDIELTSTARETVNEIEGAKGLFNAILLAKLIASITIKVIGRFRSDRDHGFHATIVEEVLREVFLDDIGQWAWGGMKEKAEAMWRQEGCVGYDLVRQLSNQVPGISLNIVGHSAGAICTANLIGLILREKFNIKLQNVALWAPACSSKMFKESFVDNAHMINNFRMYTMADRFERDDTLVNGYPWIYPSSLLYFISGVLEQFSDFPIAGMERFLSRDAPFQTQELLAISDYLAEKDRVVFSKTSETAKPGLRSASLDHGFFNQDTETLASLAHFFRSPVEESQLP